MLDPFSPDLSESSEQSPQGLAGSGSSTVCSGFGVGKNQTRVSPLVGCAVALVGFQKLLECCSLDVNREDGAYRSITQWQRAWVWGRYSVSPSVKWFHSSPYLPELLDEESAQSSAWHVASLQNISSCYHDMT